MSKPKILILGAGYGGMMSTVRLTKELSVQDAEITLVNKHNYHYQTTWLHEAAAGTIHHDRTRMLIKNVINTNRIHFVQDTVKEIKKNEKKVIMENGELDYDYLVISLGFESATFGIKGLEENAFSIRSVDTSRKIREHIEYQFASYHHDNDKDDDKLNIIVGGAGFSGIEFVGELANRVPQLCREYDIDRDKVRLINIEAAPSALPGFDKELVDYAFNLLQSKGVEFKLGTMIKECTEDSVIVGTKDSEETDEIKAGTIVWTGGVRANSIVENSGFETNRGKVPVNDDLRAPDDDHVFVVGDCALIMDPESGRPYPPTAQIAIQESYTLARNMKHLLNGEPTEKFTYKSKGTVASLGHGDAIGVVFGDKKLKGTSAAAMKKVIDDRYLFLLGGPGLLLKKGKLKLF
ncbi:NADH dehydrogenase [Scopulibacillus darangshiensis]|uniref:NADH dehydrogenase n=1 Tax=Scopulibacillus darangshiensis TaxID=442528 RepID=A0A4R2NWP1_9BACL|nr:NAD(P)/FAD-dependent oxidoreductase [Scopulibacillus darangshiensis]TCP26583.1 NADH dehydrogenase [Scopulibacillus darangshiensis]